MQQVSCPSCGNMVTFVSQTTGYAVCDACQSMLVRQDMDVSKVGESAAVQEDGTPLQLGSCGTYQKVGFEILGRIQVDYPFGFWNEWFLMFANGQHGWLGEAQGNYFVNLQTEVKDRLPFFEDLRRGAHIPINGRIFVVTDKEKARVVGCEGELPFVMQGNYQAPLADLKTETNVGATLDYSEDTPLLFIGETLAFEDLHFTNLRELQGWGGGDYVPPPSGLAARRVAPLPQTKTLRCTQCGAPQELRGGPRSQVLVCAFCDSAIDLRDPNFRILWTYHQKVRFDPAIPIGTRGTLRGEDLECIGFMRRTTTVEGIDYTWSEYLLYNPFKGYRWLTEYNGHWSLVKESPALPLDTRGPVADDPPTTAVNYQGASFKHFQTAKARVTYAIGEFYWQVQAGQRAVVMDYVNPPYVLSAEVTDDDVVWSVGEYLPPREIAAAFKSVNLPMQVGVGSNQPNPFGNAKDLWRDFALFCSLAFLITLLFAMFGQDRTVLSKGYTFYANEKERALVTDDFQVEGRTSNLAVSVHSDVNNRWAFFRLALINPDTNTAIDFAEENSYYSGVDDGERWTEGSVEATAVVPRVTAGRYYLRIDAESGTGSEADKFRDGQPAPGPEVFHYNVTVKRDVTQWWFMWAVMGLLLPLPIIQGIRSGSFENRRWMDSDHPRTSSGS